MTPGFRAARSSIDTSAPEAHRDHVYEMYQTWCRWNAATGGCAGGSGFAGEQEAGHRRGWTRRTQLLVAHLPMLARQDADVFVLGLGSGFRANLLAYPSNKLRLRGCGPLSGRLR
jgi:hypothetical protein